MRHIQHILRAINMAATSSRTCSDQGSTLSLEDFPILFDDLLFSSSELRYSIFRAHIYPIYMLVRALCPDFEGACVFIMK